MGLSFYEKQLIFVGYNWETHLTSLTSRINYAFRMGNIVLECPSTYHRMPSSSTFDGLVATNFFYKKVYFFLGSLTEVGFGRALRGGFTGVFF